MPASMRYTDSHGRRQTLTWEQYGYLLQAGHGFDRGWGGLSSTRTVRLLHERGLVVCNDWTYRDRGWRVTGRTKLGDEVAARWRDLADAGARRPAVRR